VKATILDEAEADLASAFDFYQNRKQGLGLEFLHEFRLGIDRILEYPNAWQRLDSTYRRYRLHRFPYGVVYRVDAKAQCAVVVAVMHLSRRPDWWRTRDR
jgi:plasmid stabilization system protein ParE